MKTVKITIEPPDGSDGILDIRDAMAQVRDFFDLLTSEGNPDVVWNLVAAGTNSPFTVEGVPVDRNTGIEASAQIEDDMKRFNAGIAGLYAGKPLDDSFSEKSRSIAVNLFERHSEKRIGCTRYHLADGEPIEISREPAARCLDLLKGKVEKRHGYLFPTFRGKEYGSIEGRIIEINLYQDKPSIVLKERLEQRKIRCLISDESRAEIEKHLTAEDAWKHRRISVRGVIHYNQDGKIVQILDARLPVQNGRIVFIEPREVGLEELHDPDFTGGLPVAEYLDKLRENELE